MTTSTDRTPDRVATNNPMGGAVMSGILSLVINLVVTYIISLLFPTTDLGWAMTLVAIASFFAGFFGYYGGHRQSYRP